MENVKWILESLTRILTFAELSSVYIFFLTSVAYKLCPQPTSTSMVDLLKAEPN
jgi:hypothetical protein